MFFHERMCPFPHQLIKQDNTLIWNLLVDDTVVQTLILFYPHVDFVYTCELIRMQQQPLTIHSKMS